jgi:hypothetical protein
MRILVSKGLVVGLLLASSVAIYEVLRSFGLQDEIARLRNEKADLVNQVEKLQKEHQAATLRFNTLAHENDRLRKAAAEVPRLRGEVTSLRTAQSASNANSSGRSAIDGLVGAKAKIDQMSRFLQAMPEKSIPEIELLNETDWLVATKDAKFDSEAEIRRTLSDLRGLAKKEMPLAKSLHAFIEANGGKLPRTLSDLAPYFRNALGEKQISDSTLSAIFNRYTLVATGRFADLPPDAWIVIEIAPVDKEYDTRAKFGSGRSTLFSTGLNRGGDPDDPSY